MAQEHVEAVTVRVPAKVNLRLAVGPRRADGYHDLVNVFHAVSLYDEVTAVPSGSFSVRVAGEAVAGVPLDGENLAVRAARALAAHAGVPYGARLLIRKAIPVAGGMAGGSADAAAALVACNALWGLGLPREELMEIGAACGSDVPFALLGGTAVGVGRGEVLTPAPVGGTLHWVFAVAHGGLSTARVYAECDRLREESGSPVGPPEVSEALMEALRTGDPKAVAAELVNDLQPAALSLMPALAHTLDAGLAHGALAAIVSGSGPTCAFLVSSAAEAETLAATLRALAVCSTALPAHGPVPGATIRSSA